MNYRFLYIFIFCICGMACKEKSPSGVSSEAVVVVVEGIPDDFYEFYDRFHEDEEFQIESIHFPLQGISDQGVDTLWQSTDWVLHRSFDDYNGTFERSFLNLKGIVEERISDPDGQFGMVRRFSKMDGKWKLIYYKEMQPLK